MSTTLQWLRFHECEPMTLKGETVRSLSSANDSFNTSHHGKVDIWFCQECLVYNLALRWKDELLHFFAKTLSYQLVLPMVSALA